MFLSVADFVQIPHSQSSKTGVHGEAKSRDRKRRMMMMTKESMTT
jgi:hypothetical protein